MIWARAQTEVAAPPGYELIELLSRGRRLDVFDAWSEERGCRCVIKALRPDRAEEPKARALLIEEGRLLAAMSHPHLVRAYEVLTEPAPAVVLETLTGRTLAHVMRHGPQLEPAEVAHLGLHLGSALRYLHSRHVLHLDLKPANVVAEAGRAKLIDLSVARAPGPAEPGVGTPDYMAPEQARGGELTAAADVWGLGLVLHEVAVGEPVYAEMASSGGSDSWTWSSAGDEDTDGPPPDGYYHQLESPVPSLSGRLPDELAGLIDACVAPDPRERPGVGEVLARLEGPAGLPVAERRWSRS